MAAQRLAELVAMHLSWIPPALQGYDPEPLSWLQTEEPDQGHPLQVLLSQEVFQGHEAQLRHQDPPHWCMIYLLVFPKSLKWKVAQKLDSLPLSKSRFYFHVRFKAIKLLISKYQKGTMIGVFLAFVEVVYGWFIVFWGVIHLLFFNESLHNQYWYIIDPFLYNKKSIY